MRRLFFAMFSLAGAVASQSACSVESENEWVGPPEEPRKPYDAGPITDPNDERCWVNLVEGGEPCGGSTCATGSYCYSSVGTCKPGCRIVDDCPQGQACDFAQPPPGETGNIGTCAAPPAPCAGLRSLGEGPGAAGGCADVRGVYDFALDREASHPHCSAYRARCAVAQSGCTVSFECQTTKTLLRGGSLELGRDNEGDLSSLDVPGEDACHVIFTRYNGLGWGVDAVCSPPNTLIACTIAGGSVSGSLPASTKR